jgi:hypothetical protein
MLHDCKDHLHSIDETYCQHMGHALGFGFRMIGGGIGAVIHALCPAFFKYTASSTVAKLHAELQDRIARAKHH